MIDLTDDEAEVARWVEAGNSGPYDMAGKRLRAGMIRALLMGLPVRFPGTNNGVTVKIPATGVRVMRAVLIGPLDLVDGRGQDGEPMPPLVLEACFCPALIAIDQAHIRHLSLIGSRITHLSGRGVHVESTLDLTGLASAETMATGFHGAAIRNGDTLPMAQGLCWVELQEAVIGGAVVANSAIFAAPTKREPFDPYTMPARYALDLCRAQVRVCVRLHAGVRAIGGVSLIGCKIGGDVWADGARLSAVEGDAFSGQTARIGGDVMLRAWSPLGRDTIPFSAEGVVVLSGSKITGDLEMSGAKLVGGCVAQAAEIGGAAFLRAWDGQAKGRPHTFPFTADNDVDFLGAKITGSLEMEGAKLSGDLIVANVEIGGAALLRAWEGQNEGQPQTYPFSIRKDAHLLGAKIAGSLDLSGASLNGNLIAQAVEIGGATLLRAWEGQNEGQPQTYPFTIRKDVHFLGAKIVGDLDFNGAALAGNTVIDNAMVGGNLQMQAQGVPWGDGRPFQLLTTGKNISFVNAQVSGAMIVDLEPDKCYGSSPGSPPRTLIDLCHAHVGILMDRGGRGFGTHCLLKLDGFRYDGLHQDKKSPDLHQLEVVKRTLRTRVRRSMKRWLRQMQSRRSQPSWFRKPANQRPLAKRRGVYRFQIFSCWDEVLRWRTVPLLWKYYRYLVRQKSVVAQHYIIGFCRLKVQVSLLIAIAIILATVWRLGWPIVAERVAIIVAVLCYGLWWFKKNDFYCGRWEARIDWLNLQYENGPTVEIYTPEPYEKLTATLRAAGFYGDARKITSCRLTLERRLLTPPFLRFFPWLFGVFFDYGLSPQRAVITFVACLLIGWGGVRVADHGWQSLHIEPAMVIEAHTVNTMADKDKRESGLLSAFETRVVNIVADSGKPNNSILSMQAQSSYPPVIKKLPCNGEIDPLSYAADVFVPALELHQDDKCVISPEPDAWPWRIAYALYAALGWVVTALTILTVSGILRRHVEG